MGNVLNYFSGGINGEEHFQNTLSQKLECLYTPAGMVEWFR